MNVGKLGTKILTTRLATSSNHRRVGESLFVWGKDSDYVYRLRVLGVVNGFMRAVSHWRVALDPETNHLMLIRRANWRAW